VDWPSTLAIAPGGTCTFFPITTSLETPTTGTIAGSNNNDAAGNSHCSPASALAKNTAYGVTFTFATVGEAATSYGPIGLFTTLLPNTNTATLLGPIIDSNSVFDSVFVEAEPSEISLAIERLTADAAMTKPGDSHSALYTVTFADLSTEYILAPFKLVLTK